MAQNGMAAQGAKVTAGSWLALQMLRAEMEALALLIPGLTYPGLSDQNLPAAGDRHRHDADVEAGFDNMPV